VVDTSGAPAGPASPSDAGFGAAPAASGGNLDGLRLPAAATVDVSGRTVIVLRADDGPA